MNGNISSKLKKNLVNGYLYPTVTQFFQGYIHRMLVTESFDEYQSAIAYMVYHSSVWIVHCKQINQQKKL